MDNNNNSNNAEDADDAEQQQVEQQQAEAEAAAAAEAENVERMEMISVVLERKKKAPIRTRNKIDVLVKKFLKDLGDDIHDMLCNNEADDYRGLDSNRDTEAEVETAIRFFPDVLSRREQLVSDDDDDDDDDDDEVEDVKSLYPIQCLLGNGTYNRLNLKTCSFISVLARLAIEFGSFEEELRGGLLLEDVYGDTVLQYLMCGSPNSTHSQEYHEFVDNVCLNAMKELKEIGLIIKEDILRYDLLISLIERKNTFAQKRFRFLVDCDPTALVTMDLGEYYIPLHRAAFCSDIQGFRLTFEAGIRYFPKKKGISLLFQKDLYYETPLQDACKQHGREEVMKVMEDTLTYYHSDTPINIADALVSAAIDDSIHLDCVYFLLRREPDVLQKLLSVKSETAEAVADDDDDNNNSKVFRKRKRKS